MPDKGQGDMRAPHRSEAEIGALRVDTGKQELIRQFIEKQELKRQLEVKREQLEVKREDNMSLAACNRSSWRQSGRIEKNSATRARLSSN